MSPDSECGRLSLKTDTAWLHPVHNTNPGRAPRALRSFQSRRQGGFPTGKMPVPRGMESLLDCLETNRGTGILPISNPGSNRGTGILPVSNPGF